VSPELRGIVSEGPGKPRREKTMKIVRIRDYFDTKFKEYVVGPKQTASLGIYLVLGEMEEGEVRRLGPGEGHEEILTVQSGRALVRTEGEEQELGEGEAVYIGPEFEGEIEAREEVHYFSAGGHVPGGHEG
jgi:mannose-6-phosphate isomerase-like protein (cupin superfamily)